MIKNVIFDMGNVILRYDTAKILSNFTRDESLISLFQRELFQSKEWILLDKGEIDESSAFQSICSRIPDTFHSLFDEIFTNWDKFFLPIDETYHVVKELKSKGYKLYTLTNAHKRFWSYRKNAAAFEFMDGFLVSADEKLIKPDPKIYLRLLEKFDLSAEECFFIDDMRKNVEAAIKLGFKGHIFRDDAETLVKLIENE